MDNFPRSNFAFKHCFLTSPLKLRSKSNSTNENVNVRDWMGKYRRKFLRFSPRKMENSRLIIYVGE